MPVAERILSFGEHAKRAPKISVLTPFHRHDPSALIGRLGHLGADVELVLLDDGSATAALVARVSAAAAAIGTPARVIVWDQNQGRAAARNRLIEAARGEYVLFLDADMLPDSEHYLDTWLRLIQAERPYVAFGGLSLRYAESTPATALHHGLFARSDCKPARQRERAPAQTVATANLLVRRDFLTAYPFDDGFVGWGFEDVDWALRAAKHAPITHIDNPATHVGLDEVDVLLRKCAEAGPNFGRLARKHPAAVSRFAAHRAALALKFAPARTWMRNAFAWLAREASAPMSVRCAALKLYRASHYAEYLP